MRARHAERIRAGIYAALDHAAWAHDKNLEQPVRRFVPDALKQAAYDRIFDRFYPRPKPPARPSIPARYR